MFKLKDFLIRGRHHFHLRGGSKSPHLPRCPPPNPKINSKNQIKFKNKQTNKRNHQNKNTVYVLEMNRCNVKHFSILALQSFLDWPRLLLSQDPPAECCRWRGEVGGQGETRGTPGLHITCNVTIFCVVWTWWAVWTFLIMCLMSVCIFTRTTKHFLIGENLLWMTKFKWIKKLASLNGEIAITGIYLSKINFNQT